MVVEEYTVTDIIKAFIPIGTVIRATYSGSGQKGYRDYRVIENYPFWVLCERIAEGGRYLKAFQKVDIINHSIPSEEYNL